MYKTRIEAVKKRKITVGESDDEVGGQALRKSCNKYSSVSRTESKVRKFKGCPHRTILQGDVS